MTEVTPIPKQGLPPKKRRRPIPPASPKRLAEKDRRDAVRAIVLARDPDCVGAARGLPGPCASPWPHRYAREVHETHQRSTHPGSHLDPSKCVAMCQTHHDMVSSPTGQIRKLAIALGLLVEAGPVSSPMEHDQ